MDLPEWMIERARQGRHDVQRAECLAMGTTDYQLARYVRAGFLRARGFGSYEIQTELIEDTFDGYRDAHLRKARTLVAGISGAYLCGLSALVAHGVPVLRVPKRAYLARRPRLQSRRPDVRAHRGWGSEPSQVDGFATQPLPEALIETAARFGLVAGRVGADFALREGLMTHDELEAAARTYGRRDGASFARQLVATADGRLESPAESQLHVVLAQAGIKVTPQVNVYGLEGEWIARVDFLIDGTRVALEYDGIDKYAELTQARNEKERDLRLTRAGYHVIHIVAADLKQQHLLLGRIKNHLRGASGRGWAA